MMTVERAPFAPSVVDARDEAERCREIAKANGRSFYIASFMLPAEPRRAIHAMYAFCRVADDIVDRADRESVAEAERELDDWREQIWSPRDPVAHAFARARLRYGVPAAPALELIEGVRSDLRPIRCATWSDLERYCHAVAGTVGLLTAPVLGCRDDAALVHASELGIAMQLTNIVRDVAEDAEVGRVYLPEDELAAFGCDPESVLRGEPTGDFTGLIRWQIDRARTLYRSALQGVPALDWPGRLATLTAAHLYAEILREVERAGCDPFRGRAHVSATRKVRKAPGVAAAFMRTWREPWPGYGRAV